MAKDKSGGNASQDVLPATNRISDPRFAKIQHSSLFRRPSKKQTRVAVDSRWKRMVRDEAFSSKPKVDRYGRRLQPARASDNGKSESKARSELERLYKFEDEDEQDDEQDVSGSGDEDEEVQAELSRVDRELKDKPYDPARDGGFSESSSSEESSDEESVEDAEEEEPEIPFPNAQSADTSIPEGSVTRRFAVVNLDWDHIRATDLMAVFSSFALPARESGNGGIEMVSVYPSEFGKERMEREETEGPPKELFAGRKNGNVDEFSENSEDDEDQDERIRKSLVQEDTGEEVSSAHLRRYQLERLRYYYAVVTCSSPFIAQNIYQTVDGIEYQSSANFFDLRFIPDETDFSDDRARDECTKLPEKYKPTDFVTDALQHSKVKLTWDAEDTKRKEAQKRAFSGSRKDIDENDLKAYLGSDSSSSEDEEDGGVEVVDATNGNNNGTSEIQSKGSKKGLERQKMRSLLGLGAEPELEKPKSKSSAPVGDMQVTFTSALSSGKTGSVFEKEPERDETTVEKYARKEKERKARRKERAKASRAAGGGDAVITTNVVPDKESEDGDLGFEDPFFTMGADAVRSATSKEKKEERRHKREERAAEEARVAAERAELELLMDDSNQDMGNGRAEPNKINHFSLPTLQKAEKAIRKQKSKHARLSKGEKAALEAKEKDDFQMDVADDRFTAVYNRPEFALDPTHPGAKDTEGMRKLLAEGRARREKREREEDSDGGVPVFRVKKPR